MQGRFRFTVIASTICLLISEFAAAHGAWIPGKGFKTFDKPLTCETMIKTSLDQCSGAPLDDVQSGHEGSPQKASSALTPAKIADQKAKRTKTILCLQGRLKQSEKFPAMCRGQYIEQAQNRLRGDANLADRNIP